MAANSDVVMGWLDGVTTIDGGDAAAATNNLALQLLKTQLFAATADTRRTAQTVNPQTGTAGAVSAGRQNQAYSRCLPGQPVAAVSSVVDLCGD